MAHGYHHHGHNRILNAANDPLILHAVAPPAVLRSAEGLAELPGIGCAEDALVHAGSNLTGNRRANGAQVAHRAGVELIFPLHAKLRCG